MKVETVDGSAWTCLKCGKLIYYSLQCGKCGTTIKLPDANSFKTQKVKGMFSLKDEFPYGRVLLPQYVFSSEEEIEKEVVTTTFFNSPLFARPCPLRPRHGFVDSRVVGSVEELKGVMKETLAADPDGEVMLMGFIKSSYNAIWTPSLLSIGKGHDGATCGKETINIPLAGLMCLSPEALQAAKITSQEWPYVEAVVEEHTDRIHLAQLRAGPKGDSRPDFLPFAMTVGEVIQVDPASSLLEWEERIKGLKGRTDLIISHPGGSMVDHFSVHARSFNIPIVTSFFPIVGMEINPAPSIPPSPSAILKGLVVGDGVKLAMNQNDYTNVGQQAVALLLLALHNSSAMEGENGFWLGVGAALMMRLGGMALKGEARHIHSPMKEWRGAVYQKAVGYSLRRHRASLPRLVHTLRYGQFGGSGVGGRKWALCGAATAKLFDAVGVLAKEPTQESVGVFLRAYNNAVNQAHNGGWWLNKFASAQLFNTMQKGDLMGTLSIIPLVSSIIDFSASIPETVMERKIGVWKGWKEINLTPTKIVKAEVSILPGVGGITFNVSDRRLKTRHKPITVKTEEVMQHLSSIIGEGGLYVVSGEGGLRVEIRRPHLAPIKIWEEEALEGSALSSKE